MLLACLATLLLLLKECTHYKMACPALSNQVKSLAWYRPNLHQVISLACYLPSACLLTFNITDGLAPSWCASTCPSGASSARAHCAASGEQ